MKYLIWLVIALAVVVWMQRAKKNLLRRARDAAQAGGVAPGGRSEGAAKAIEQMVQCAQCGIHFPTSEAIRGSAGAVFCCVEHRELHALEAGGR
jgi:uncharacterized protein